MFTPGTLLAGGIVAALATAWQQVKSVFSYLSSFIIVQAKLDGSTSHILRRHLRTQWRMLPSGLHSYKGRYYVFKGDSGTSFVPYKLPSESTVYRKGWQFLFVSEGEYLNVKYIRGLLDFDGMLRQIIHAYNTKNADTKEPSRFRVRRLMGRERDQFSANPVKPRVEPTPGGNDVVTADSASNTYFDPSTDEPLLYDRSMWLKDSTGDDPFEGLYFPDNVLDRVRQLKHWKANGAWYAERMIPWRRGMLFHGIGGTGKSSLASAIAQVLEIPIYQFFLSTMSDQEFIQFWEEMHTPCVALFEDFDNVFHGRENVTAHKLLTFDCVLNQISGVDGGSGVLLIVTTNHIEHIDPAMGVELKNEGGSTGVSTRPGRIDDVIEIGFLEQSGKEKMAKRILKDWPDAVAAMAGIAYDVTPAQFQEMCVQEAYKRIKEQS